MSAIEIINGSLRHIDLSTADPDEVLRGAAFPFSNDERLSQRYQELEHGARLHPYTEHDVAMIVGNGAALSMIPVLPERIYFTDRSHGFLAWMHTLVQQVRDTKKLSEFDSWVRDMLREQKDEMQQETMRWEAESIAPYHHTASQKRYAFCRSKLLSTDIHFVALDLRDEPSIVEFGRHLDKSDQRIRVANLTNVLTHIFAYSLFEEKTENRYEGFVMGLISLPVSPQALIFGSSGDNLFPLDAASTAWEFVKNATDDLDEAIRMKIETTEV